MSGLGLYLEEEGLSTVCIALVREHALAVQPPRALWVPFPLGRPFGAPDNAASQREIVLAALDLLGRPAGPVLEDFETDSPDFDEPGSAAWVCPVSFPGRRPEADDHLASLLDEIRALEPWYERSREQRNRSTVGLSGLPISDAARVLVSALDDSEASSTPALVDSIRYAAEDVKSFYYEAVTAQSGSAGQAELERWFWKDTEAGTVLKTLRQSCLNDSRPDVNDIGDFMLVPDAYLD